HHSPIRGRYAPCFSTASRAPYNFDGLAAHCHNRGLLLDLEHDSPLVLAMHSLRCLLAARLEPVGANDLALERSTFDTELANVEVALMAQHREDDPTQTVGNGDDRHLVASSRAQPCEVGIERMVGTTRVMRRFTEHRTQLRRPALGDPPVRV